jgi:uncharacterized protein
MTDTSTNTRTVQQVFENFGAMSRERSWDPEMKTLLDLYDDDVEWHVPDMEDVRLSGRRRGREAVKEFFSTVAEDYDVLRFEPREYIAEGDKVVVVGNYAWRVRATGKEFSSDFAQVYTVREGKIVKFDEFMDTAAELEAHKKRGGRRDD